MRLRYLGLLVEPFHFLFKIRSLSKTILLGSYQRSDDRATHAPHGTLPLGDWIE